MPMTLSPRPIPDWLLNGGQEVNGFVWLDPTHPEVEQYFVELFTEFAYLYHKLEGIQLDDHWAVPSQFWQLCGTAQSVNRKGDTDGEGN